MKESIKETKTAGGSIPAAPRKGKKLKKNLVTPTVIIRYIMIATYAIAIYLLTFSLTNTTLYINDDLNTGIYNQNSYTHIATQEEIDAAADELEGAIKELKESGVVVNVYQSSLDLNTATYKWVYHTSKDVDSDKLRDLINQARAIDRRYYTEDTVKRLNTATLKAQHVMCATLTVSQSALQIMIGGSVADAYGDDNMTISIGNYVLIYALGLLPLAGLFIAAFDKRTHIKNIYAACCSVLCIVDIMMLVFPSVGIGSVLTIFLYFILFGLSALAFYAKQQEDYIVAHPELEAEYTEKHPQFVKALINHKHSSVPAQTKKEKELSSAKNAKKHGVSRK